jgi:hypothetical protein
MLKTEVPFKGATARSGASICAPARLSSVSRGGSRATVKWVTWCGLCWRAVEVSGHGAVDLPDVLSQHGSELRILVCFDDETKDAPHVIGVRDEVNEAWSRGAG